MNALQLFRRIPVPRLATFVCGLAIAGVLTTPGTATAEPNARADHIDCADVNQSGDVTSGDIIYMVNFVFKGGADPDCPGLSTMEAIESSLRNVTDGHMDAAGQPLLSGLVDQIVVQLNSGATSEALTTLAQLGDSAIALYELEILREFEASEVIHSSAILMPGLLAPDLEVSTDLMLQWFQAYRECVLGFMACLADARTTTACMFEMAECVPAWLGSTQTLDASEVDQALLLYLTCLPNPSNAGDHRWCATQAAWFMASQLVP